MRTCLNNVWSETVQGFWRVTEERHPSQIRLREDLTTQIAAHNCVLVPSPNKTSDLSRKPFDCKNRLTVRLLFLDSAHTLQVKNTRSKSWGAAHERTIAVSFFLYAFWRNRSQVRGCGIMKKIPALIAWHCVLFSLLVPSLDA